MKEVILKINDKTQTLAEHQVIIDDNQPTVIDAIQNVNYELVDAATGKAPSHIFTERLNDELYITMDYDGRQSDLIIMGYYSSDGTELIGLAADDHYYHYVPANARVDSFIATLDSGESKSQVLGDQMLAAPWWVGASEISVVADTVLAHDSGSYNVETSPTYQVAETDSPQGYGLPILMGLAGLGAVGYLLSSKKDEDTSKNENQTNNAKIDVAKEPLTEDILVNDILADRLLSAEEGIETLDLGLTDVLSTHNNAMDWSNSVVKSPMNEVSLDSDLLSESHLNDRHLNDTHQVQSDVLAVEGHDNAHLHHVLVHKLDIETDALYGQPDNIII